MSDLDRRPHPRIATPVSGAATTSSPANALAPAAASAPIGWALTSLSLSMLMPTLDTSIANAGLPAMAVALHTSFQGVQWIVLAYLLTITTLTVSVGRFGDIVGRSRMLLMGIALFTGASLTCGLAPSLAWLIAARALQGLGAAIMMALTVAMVSEIVPKTQLGRAMGLLGSMSAIGTTLGPSLGGVLTGAFGWRSIFLVNVPLGVLNLLMAYRFLFNGHQTAQRLRVRFDHGGTVILALTLGAYALAMTVGSGQFGALNMLLLAAVVSGVALFVLYERRVDMPLVHLQLFRDRALRARLAMSAGVSAVVMTTLVVGPFYLSHTLQLSTTHVGLALSAGPLMAALTGIPAGRLVDRFGAARMSIAGLIGMFSSCILLSVLPESLGVRGYLAPIVVLTVGYALFQAANNSEIMATSRDSQRGVISGLLSLSRNLGLITGAAAMGAVFSLATGAPDITQALPHAIARGMHATFAVSAVIVLIALILAAYSVVVSTRARPTVHQTSCELS